MIFILTDYFRQFFLCHRITIFVTEVHNMRDYYQTPYGQYHGPLPVRDFFPVPNHIFDLGLTAEEIAIYAFLLRCEDRRTFTCYPSYRTIGEAIGKSKNTVIKYMRALEEKGLIYAHSTFVVTKDGARNGNLSFALAPIRSASDVNYYQQMWDRNNIPYRKPRKRKNRR